MSQRSPNGEGRASAGARLSRALLTHPTRRAGANITLWTILGLFVLLLVLSVVFAPPPKSTRAVDHLTATSAGTPNARTRPAVTSQRGANKTTSASPASAHPSRYPAPADTTGGVTINAAGAVLPDRRRTPGAFNPAVTQSTIYQTICVSGWTSTVRPSSDYTTALKEGQLASGYAYHHDAEPGNYEEDHLVSLELGGSPTSELNLWPEPYAATDGARVKDSLENKLHADVCSGTLSLATARRAIDSNWWTAYVNYVGTAPTTAPRTPAPSPPPRISARVPAPPPPVAPAPPAGATARCNDGTYSYAAHHQGACSHHGGVAVFYH